MFIRLPSKLNNFYNVKLNTVVLSSILIWSEPQTFPAIDLYTYEMIFIVHERAGIVITVC